MFQHSFSFFRFPSHFSLYFESHNKAPAFLFFPPFSLCWRESSDSLVVITTVSSTIVTAFIASRISSSRLLFLGWLVRRGQHLHVVLLGDVLVTAHVDVEQVALAKDVHAELEEEVLRQAPLHLHAVVGAHVPVGHHVGVAGRVLAVLDGLAEACSQSALLDDLLEPLLHLQTIHLCWTSCYYRKCSLN